MAEMEKDQSELSPGDESEIEEPTSDAVDEGRTSVAEDAEFVEQDEADFEANDQEQGSVIDDEPESNVVEESVVDKTEGEMDEIIEGKEVIEEAEAKASVDASTDDEPEAVAEVEESAEAEASVDASTEVDSVEQDEVPEDDRHWYVVHCYSGYENKVRHNLEQRIETMGMKSEIFDVVVPTEEEIEIKDGKKRTVERRVFPGYILVQMILSEESWYVVRNTPGVTGFVGMGNEPTPLRPEEVASIVKRMEAEAPRIKVTYKLGQKVRIIDGPFNDFIGTVDDIDMERAKVRVMVSFFGRETPVELDFLQVEKA
jgi:transcriptional antiterminator NusG